MDIETAPGVAGAGVTTIDANRRWRRAAFLAGDNDGS